MSKEQDSLLRNIVSDVSTRDGWGFDEKWFNEHLPLLREVYTQTASLVRKEIGEWLSSRNKTGHLNRTVIEYLIDNLLKGKMPEE